MRISGNNSTHNHLDDFDTRVFAEDRSMTTARLVRERNMTFADAQCVAWQLHERAQYERARDPEQAERVELAKRQTEQTEQDGQLALVARHAIGEVEGTPVFASMSELTHEISRTLLLSFADAQCLADAWKSRGAVLVAKSVSEVYADRREIAIREEYRLANGGAPPEPVPTSINLDVDEAAVAFRKGSFDMRLLGEDVVGTTHRLVREGMSYLHASDLAQRVHAKAVRVIRHAQAQGQ